MRPSTWQPSTIGGSLPKSPVNKLMEYEGIEGLFFELSFFVGLTQIENLGIDGAVREVEEILC
jgi:hypothetical protein